MRYEYLSQHPNVFQKCTDTIMALTPDGNKSCMAQLTFNP